MERRSSGERARAGCIDGTARGWKRERPPVLRRPSVSRSVTMFDIGAHARPRPPWGSHSSKTRSKIGLPDTMRASLRCRGAGAVEVWLCCRMRKRRSPCSGRERAPPRYDAKSPSRRLTGGAGAHCWISTRSCSALPTGKKSVVVIARKESVGAEGELVERHGKQRCVLRGESQWVRDPIRGGSASEVRAH